MEKKEKSWKTDNALQRWDMKSKKGTGRPRERPGKLLKNTKCQKREEREGSEKNDGGLLRCVFGRKRKRRMKSSNKSARNTARAPVETKQKQKQKNDGTKKKPPSRNRSRPAFRLGEKED